jgi:hypothetical protein
MHNFHSPGDSLRWAELVELLHGRLDTLAETFTARVRDIPEYAEKQVGSGDLEVTARETFRRLVDGLRGQELRQQSTLGPAMESLLEFAADLGAKRARAGIPPEALISAVRLDFSIIWEGLLQIADAEDAALLASSVDRVWRVVDQFATRTHTSYLTERVRMAQEESSIRREFIARLFNQASPTAETVSQVAAALGVDSTARFGLVAASGDAAASLRTAATSLGSGQQTRSRFFVHEFGGNTYAFWPFPPYRDGARHSVPAALTDIPCGYVPGVAGLRALPAAARTAGSLASLLRPSDSGPLSAEAAWARLAKQQMLDVGLDLLADLEAGLSGCRGGERERLKETVQHYLETGSITATAQQLFCHRNTILNRISRFQDLTGVDLAVPAQTARLVVAWA